MAAKKYAVTYSSTDDLDMDAEAITAEHVESTLDEIVETCRRLGVRARVLEDGVMLGTFLPAIGDRITTVSPPAEGSSQVGT
jgi:hypothetical protein